MVSAMASLMTKQTNWSPALVALALADGLNDMGVEMERRQRRGYLYRALVADLPRRGAFRTMLAMGRTE